MSGVFKSVQTYVSIRVLRARVGRVQNGHPWETVWERAMQFQDAQKGH